jgi:hypothetical protein
VRGDDLGRLVLLRAPEREQELRRREVLRLALAPRDRLVGDPLDEVLEEGVLPVLGRAPVGLDREQLLANERRERGFELRLGQTCERAQSLLREDLAEHRRVLEQPPLISGEAVEARGDQRVQRLRHLERPDRTERPVRVPLAREQAAIEQHAHRLDGVERDPLSAREDARAQLVG